MINYVKVVFAIILLVVAFNLGRYKRKNKIKVIDDLMYHDDKAQKKRVLIYVLCILVIALLTVALFLV